MKTAQEAAELTARQSRFVEEYLVDLNATQAAIRAGYSESNARQQASKMLTNPNIEAAISEGRKKLSERTGIDAERVIQEIARLALGDPRKVFDENGALLRPKYWDDDTAAMIAGVDVVTRPSTDDEKDEVERVHKLKFWDKNSALDKLMKHLGEYAADKHEHTGKDGEALNTQTVVVLPAKHGTD